MICSLTSHESRSTHLTPVAPAAPLSPFLEAPVMVYTDHPLIQNLIERVAYINTGCNTYLFGLEWLSPNMSVVFHLKCGHTILWMTVPIKARQSPLS